MNLCNEHKEEICHEGRNCPACEIQSELDQANEALSKEQDKVAELEGEIENLKQELKDAQ